MMTPPNPPSEFRAEIPAVPCTRHPQTETRLRCTECETPICPQCMVMYEAGFKCPACAKSRPSHAEQVGAGQMLLAAFLACCAAYAYGWLHNVLLAFSFIRPLGIPVLAYLVAYGLGVLSGNFIQRLLRFKINRVLTLAVTSAAVSGLLLSTPIQVQLLGLWEILRSMPDATRAGTSAVLYLLPHGLALLGTVIFIKGLCRPFQRL